jgi:hypothetical protein
MLQHLPISAGFETIFLALQTCVVAFLLFHDWVPLGRLNNLAAIRGQDTLPRRILVTLLPAVPAAVGLLFSARHFGQSYPHWLEMFLWITYGLFILGTLRAWWIPYLVLPDKERAARYQIIFAGTHSFLPRRNGMAPDTLHTLFHLVTLATLVALFIRDRMAAHM